MEKQISFQNFKWFCEPAHSNVLDNQVTITTDPERDFWQRTYYGFRHNDAHAFYLPIEEDSFSFFVKAEFTAKKLFDQCGVVLYQDEDNWMKASLEYEAPGIAQLGSVVTNLGYSDWAGQEVSDQNHTIYYRISRRGQDFEICTSMDGEKYKFMRMFHMHQPISAANIGIYACSPLQSSVDCTFSELRLTKCQWELYENPDMI